MQPYTGGQSTASMSLARQHLLGKCFVNPNETLSSCRSTTKCNKSKLVLDSVRGSGADTCCMFHACMVVHGSHTVSMHALAAGGSGSSGRDLAASAREPSAGSLAAGADSFQHELEQLSTSQLEELLNDDEAFKRFATQCISNTPVSVRIQKHTVAG